MENRLAEYQFTTEEAIEFAQSGKWKELTTAERGLFQLRQDKLCMDFSSFHEGITALLDRSVWTHEFADPDTLWLEYHGGEASPDFAAIVAKLDRFGKPVAVVEI